MKNKFIIIFLGLVFVSVLVYKFTWLDLTPIQKEMTKREWNILMNN